MITADQLRAIAPKCRLSDWWAPMLSRSMDEFEINTPLRSAAFVAQIAHESMQLNRTDENLNYSADALRSMFDKYFPEQDLSSFHRRPEQIANRVYANRMGNGDEQSGDGWRYRGHGLIQLTGKRAYEMYQNATNVPAVMTPALLMLIPDACRSAAWFWKTNGLNELADADEFLKITKRINGGTTGQAERQVFCDRAKKVLL